MAKDAPINFIDVRLTLGRSGKNPCVRCNAQLVRCRQIHAQRTRVLPDRQHLGDAIDMAGHPMPSQAVTGAQRRFEVHARARLFGAEGGDPQGLSRHVGNEAVRGELRHGQANAVDADAVTERQPLSRDGREADFDAQILGGAILCNARHNGGAARLQPPHAAYLLHDAREHSILPLQGPQTDAQIRPHGLAIHDLNAGRHPPVRPRQRASGLASCQYFGATYSSHSSPARRSKAPDNSGPPPALVMPARQAREHAVEVQGAAHGNQAFDACRAHDPSARTPGLAVMPAAQAPAPAAARILADLRTGPACDPENAQRLTLRVDAHVEPG